MEEHAAMAGSYFDKIIELGGNYLPTLVGGIIALILGLWLAKIITNAIGKALVKSKVDNSLIPFFKSLTSVLLKILVVISVMGMVGIQMTSFIAILGAAGLAVGMALSGTLQNFAGGVIILILKPFKIGDFIDAQGYSGIVKEISIFATTLNTVDKKLVIIPNGPLSTGALVNFSTEEQRRVDWTFGIAYGDNTEDFKKAINEFIAEDARILKDPESFIGLSELGDSSVNFAVRVWVNSADYWGVFFDMNEKVYNRFGDYKLNIPFPQMDVNFYDKK